MNPLPNLSTCRRCGAQTNGRANRQFCSDACRSAAHYGGSRTREAGPVAAEAPPAPASLDETARAVWATVFTTVPVDLDADGQLVQRYAETVSRRAEALRILDREGPMSTGSQGQEVIHPLVRLVDSLDRSLLAMESELGLTPKARDRLGWTQTES